MKITGKHVVLLLVLAVAAYYFFAYLPERTTEITVIPPILPESEDLHACRSNSQCVLVERRCCPCDGYDAINKEYLERWRNATIVRCGLVRACPLAYCVKPTHAACLQGVCRVFHGNSVAEK